MSMRTLIFVMALGVVTQAGWAEVTICKHGKTERRVEVKYAEGEKKVPCEVKYYKEGDEAGKVLWSANSDASYCETKGQEFVAKLGGQGYECAAEGGAAAEAKSETKTETKTESTKSETKSESKAKSK